MVQRKKEAEEISLKIPTLDEAAIGIKENVVSETVRELPININTITTSIPEGYREFKFPSFALIKDKLNNGSSLISSKTDCFNVQTIWGIFCGVTAPVLDVTMKGVIISQDYKGNGLYHISGAFDVIFANNVKIPIILTSYDRHESEFVVQGGTKTEAGNFYIASTPENLKIMFPVKNKPNN